MCAEKRLFFGAREGDAGDGGCGFCGDMRLWKWFSRFYEESWSGWVPPVLQSDSGLADMDRLFLWNDRGRSQTEPKLKRSPERLHRVAE